LTRREEHKRGNFSSRASLTFSVGSTTLPGERSRCCRVGEVTALLKIPFGVDKRSCLDQTLTAQLALRVLADRLAWVVAQKAT
jgi:hypothetical protein